MTPAFFRFPASLLVIRRFPLVALPHSLTITPITPQSHFEAKKARFGPKSLDSLIAKNLGSDQGL